MDDLVNDFFSESSDNLQGNFYQVIPIHDNPKISWESLKIKVPNLCRGWVELARLPTRDRIDFLREYWLVNLPYKLENHQSLTDFFNRLKDIGIFILQQKFDDPYECRLVYTLGDNRGFYHGGPGAEEEELAYLQKLFPDHLIPEDYLAFLKIHNGFTKAIDTGVLSIQGVEECYEHFQTILEMGDPILLSDGRSLDPKTLIPFYESFGMPVFQCFWSEWYPEQEMGNIYYSEYTRTISDARKSKSGPEQLAFPTFLDWLCFYLETVEW